MREALAAMTTRGRAFVAAGITALVCAVILGQEDLLRVGALLLLPVVTAFFIGRSRYRLVRSVSPTQVTAGKEARVQLDLTNDGRLPTGLLLLEDQVPYVLDQASFRRGPDGHRPQALGGVRRTLRRPRQVHHRPALRASQRPVRHGRAQPDLLLHDVAGRHPPCGGPPPIPLSGAWTGSGDNRPRAFASGSAEDVTVREYRQGDDLRRVHWRSSARVGDLMVRREEQPWQSRATLFLDNRRARPSRPGRRLLARARSVGCCLRRGAPRETGLHRAAGHGVRRRAGRLLARARQPGRRDGTAPRVARGGDPDGRSDLDTRWLQDPGHSGLLRRWWARSVTTTRRRSPACATRPPQRWPSHSTSRPGVGPVPAVRTRPA